MPLEEILSNNQEFLASRTVLETEYQHTAKPRKHWAIVTCMSSNLVGFIHQALGFKRGDAVFIQNAGNTITPYDNSIIRSLAVAIYTLDVKEVAIIGHTNCGMKMDVAPVTDTFAKYGKTREMFKDVDLREWFGLIPNEEINIRKVVDAIKQSPFIPQEIPVYGLLIDIKGQIKEVYKHQQMATAAPKVKLTTEPLIPLAEEINPHNQNIGVGVKPRAQNPNVVVKSKPVEPVKPAQKYQSSKTAEQTRSIRNDAYDEFLKRTGKDFLKYTKDTRNPEKK
ncbi:MAG TPA: carbonic anhydrase [Planctomycetota bacterium]|nr:carbonic anhydrase [Planctomycetota bacterium]